MLKCYCANLHIHTALSPCASGEMTPQNIVRMAKLNHNELIAVTDHNSGENVSAVMGAGAEHGVAVLPGMEVQSREDIHLLCYFDRIDDLLSWQEIVYGKLPPIENKEELFGPQLLFDSRDRELGKNNRLLLNGIDLSLEEIIEEVNFRKGICVPAHIDRRAYSVLEHLGFIPSGLPIAAVEGSRAVDVQGMQRKYPYLTAYPFIVSSDAHNLEEMVFNRTYFYLMEPTLDEICLALRGKEGRKVVIV